MDFKKELDEMRRRYSENPLKPMKLPRPSWLNEKDDLRFIYTEQETLFTKGRICYASLIQANSILFKFLPQWDCPATIIYSTSPEVEENPDILSEIAHTIFYYKNKPSEEIPVQYREFARVITDELDRSSYYGEISDFLEKKTIDAGFTSLMIFRKHLPKRKLCGRIMPLIASPENCKSVMVLPKQYWSEDFTKMWIQGII
ncbi:MAG: hypothetical protein SPE43_01235 [Ruminococcus sp.]|nr:hypothetical protein [Oscillospiraceae bacterium]MDY4412988.1 hypothetical protein [Ruminococcus sp.]